MKILALLGAAVLLAAGAVACGGEDEGLTGPLPTVGGGGPSPVVTATQVGGHPAPVEAALRDLADRLGLDPDQIEVVEAERVDWPDACLGLARPGEACAQVITPGYRVILQAGGQQYEYHTDLGRTVRPVP